MTLHTNQLRYNADKKEKDGYWCIEAADLLNKEAEEIDRLRHSEALLNIQLTYAQKQAQTNGS